MNMRLGLCPNVYDLPLRYFSAIVIFVLVFGPAVCRTFGLFKPPSFYLYGDWLRYFHFRVAPQECKITSLSLIIEIGWSRSFLNVVLVPIRVVCTLIDLNIR
jgi:hypothetical protein